MFETIAQLQGLPEFALRFGINLVSILIIVRGIYYPIRRNRDFLFTFLLFNIINFLICFLLSTAKLKMGFAFGLFAIFSILRYRTVTVPVREMGYFFISVTLGIINSLTALSGDSFVLLVLANVFVAGFAYVVDYKVKIMHENFKDIVYDRIELLVPDRREELLTDLRQRTGLNIHKVEIQKFDFFRDSARIYAFYESDKNDAPTAMAAAGDDD